MTNAYNYPSCSTNYNIPYLDSVNFIYIVITAILTLSNKFHLNKTKLSIAAI